MANTLELGNGKWATGKDTVLAFNDENNNFKPLPFDFTRDTVATVVNKDGLIETIGSGEPRIDFSNDAKGALLLEPIRTNRMPNSEDGSTWALSNITLSSLSGGLNKEYYQITSLGNTGRFDTVKNDWINLTAGTYTASVFAKKGTTDQIILTSRANSTTQDKYSVFNLTSGIVVSSNQVTGSIEPYSDGWYKCSITFTNSGSYTDFASFAFGFNFNSSSTDTLFVASPQSEIGSYATSYIPTSGSAATRSADSSSQTPPSGIIGQTEGTMFFEIDFANISGVSGAWSISNGSSANRITMNTTTSSSTEFILSVAQNYNSGSTKLASTNVTYSDNHKVAIKYSATTLKLFVDGQLADSVATDGFGNYTNFYLGGNHSGVYGGDTRKFIQADLYNTALTDAELQALTT